MSQSNEPIIDDAKADAGASLVANLEHAIALRFKILRLKKSYAETLDCCYANARDVGELPYEMVADIYEWLKANGIPAGQICRSLGFAPSEIAYAKREGVPPLPKPGRFCVYLLKQEGFVNYVGFSGNVRARLKTHRRLKQIPFDDYEIFRIGSKAEALDLEAVLIQQHRPPYNRRIEKRKAS